MPTSLGFEGHRRGSDSTEQEVNTAARPLAFLMLQSQQMKKGRMELTASYSAMGVQKMGKFSG